mmetsp:Transcript_26398/g.56254  ORF Transcript_26398/g.56254 Transcript_26398/m.56254 type:complete len:424 (-) Transcript_26398:141-1412(-)
MGFVQQAQRVAERVPTWVLVTFTIGAVAASFFVDEAYAALAVFFTDLCLESITLVAFALGWAVITYSKRSRPTTPMNCKEQFEVECDAPGNGAGDMMRQVISLSNSRHYAQAFTLYKEIVKTAGSDVVGFAEDAGVDVQEFFRAVAVAGVLPGPARSAPAKRLIEDMRSWGVPRSSEFYDVMMRAMTRKQGYQQAADIFEELQRDQVAPTSDSAACLVTSLVEVGDVDGALGLFKTLAPEQFKPSIRVYMFLLKALHSATRGADALMLLQDARRRGVVVDALCFNMVLGTLLKSGRGLEAAEMYVEARDSGAPGAVDCVSLNTAMIGLVRARHPERAAGLIEEAVLAGSFEVNLRTYRLLADIVDKSAPKYRAAIMEALKKMQGRSAAACEALLQAAMSKLARMQFTDDSTATGSEGEDSVQG